MHVQMPGFEYLERKPCASLRHLVASFRTMRASSEVVAAKPIMRTLPDGCSELVFTVSGIILDRPTGQPMVNKPRSFYMGPLERVRLAVASGPLDAVSVFLRPGALPLLNGGQPQQLVDCVVPAEAIAPRDSLGLLERAMEATVLQERIGWMEKYMLWWANRAAAPDAVISHAVRFLEETYGDVRMDELAEKTGYSQRQFERRFANSIGMTPKAYARVVRFHRALHQWCQSAEQKYQTHFLDGFFDQSHMIKEFHKFCGMTPTDLSEELSQALVVRGLASSTQIATSSVFPLGLSAND
jgi:AraC-like DNA-binding protein